MSSPILSEITVIPQGHAGGSTPIALTMKNGMAVPLASVPSVDWETFSTWAVKTVTNGGRFVTLFTLPQNQGAGQNAPLNAPQDTPQDAPQATLQANTTQTNTVQANTVRAATPTTGATYTMVIVIAEDFSNRLYLLGTPVSGGFSSLTPEIPAANIAERILCEEYNLLPAGHPWLKPVRFSRLPEEGGPTIGITDYYRVEGEEVHEVGVGPVHAGVIECGHFRFQCVGEEVIHLEISLGYHHRGVQKLLHNAAHAHATKKHLSGQNIDNRTLSLMEVIAGDSTVAHTWSYATVLEALGGTSVSPHGQKIRSLALELERLANHTGDLGALSGDAGFLPTQSYCGRLRGDWLNTTALLCGNRFSRGLVKPGGANVYLDAPTIAEIRRRVNATAKDVNGAVNLLWNSSSFMSRVSNLGAVSKQNALALGLVGPGTRACGVHLDCRIQHPLPHLPEPPILQRKAHGDVLSRAIIRHEEIKESVNYCLRLLDSFAMEKNTAPMLPVAPTLQPEHLAIGMVEGFRGEVCHIGVTDAQGKLTGYTIVDPSIHNWPGLALALRNQEISDFPLCNKSFNLSYCGHDL